MSTFSKKKFIAAGETWIDGQRRQWIESVRANPYARKYALREGWILATESLDAISALSLFPDADLIARANAVDLGAFDITENEAKLAISSAVKAGIAEAMAGIEAVKASEHSQGVHLYPPQPILTPPTPRTVSGSETTPKTPPAASGRAVAGHIEAVATDVIRVHRANIGGTEVYTTQRNIMDTLQAAQVQGITLKVDYELGDFGNRVVGCKVTDAVKGQ